MSIAVGLTALLALAAPGSEGAGGSHRGNEAMHRSRGAVFSVAAAPRLGVLLAGGADVIQPVGFGAGLQFRVHGLHLGPLRFGGELQLGHTRYLQRRNLSTGAEGETQTIRRYAALGHTDFALGPSVQLVAGPVLFEVGFGAGLGISSFTRPLGPFPVDEEHYSDVSAMIRGGGHLVVPVRNNQGALIGVAVHKYFSRTQIVADPPDETPPEGMEPEPDTNPFDMMIEIYLGYHFMF
jgi:hypothetical protein